MIKAGLLTPFVCYDLYMKKDSAPNRIESISKIYEYGNENLQGHEYLDRFEGLTGRFLSCQWCWWSAHQ